MGPRLFQGNLGWWNMFFFSYVKGFGIAEHLCIGRLLSNLFALQSVLLGGGFKHFWNFHPYLGKISHLTSIFFRWVGSTTNQPVLQDEYWGCEEWILCEASTWCWNRWNEQRDGGKLAVGSYVAREMLAEYMTLVSTKAMVVVSNISYVHPFLGKIPSLTIIFFNWVVQPPTRSSTNEHLIWQPSMSGWCSYRWYRWWRTARCFGGSWGLPKCWVFHTSYICHFFLPVKTVDILVWDHSTHKNWLPTHPIRRFDLAHFPLVHWCPNKKSVTS